MKINIKAAAISLGLSMAIFLSVHMPTLAANYEVSHVTLNYPDTSTIEVVNNDKVLFSAQKVDEYVYTTQRQNVRDVPTVHSTPITTLNTGIKVKRVGISDIGWDIVQIGNEKYFMWGEYLSLQKPKTNNTQLLGYYDITHYCSCAKCNGSWAGRPTASGAYPQINHTVACNSLPIGTKIMIEGQVYTVEDTGGMGNSVIDVYVGSHSEALNRGRKKKVPVYKVI